MTTQAEQAASWESCGETTTVTRVWDDQRPEGAYAEICQYAGRVCEVAMHLSRYEWEQIGRAMGWAAG